jgi:hypothetical protein
MSTRRVHVDFDFDFSHPPFCISIARKAEPITEDLRELARQDGRRSNQQFLYAFRGRRP